MCASVLSAVAAEDNGRALARALVQRAFKHAEAEYAAQPESADTAWKLGRAYFDLGEFAESRSERASFAEKGIAACIRAVKLQSNSAPAYYYWGLNLGQLARTKGLGALKLVREMEGHFRAALKLDERFDHAGPHRNLGYLYRDTPSWGSIGDRDKARHHLQRAVALSPDFPENRLALLEGRIKWNELELAARELRQLEKIWSEAKKLLTGPVWAVAWQDWEKQLEGLKKRLNR